MALEVLRDWWRSMNADPPSQVAAGPAPAPPAVGPGLGVGSTMWGTGYGRMAQVTWPDTVSAGFVWGRDAAMTVPTVSRARDLHCSAVSSLPFTFWRIGWDDAANEPTETRLPPPRWADRPDRNVPRCVTVTWTVDDLFFTGAAYWHVTERYADGFPSAFERMPAADVHIDSDGRLRWGSLLIPPNDVVEFRSPIEGVLTNGWRTIGHAVDLDTAAARYALNTIAGWLQQEDGEPMTGDELTQLAERMSLSLQHNIIAALNQSVSYHEPSMDPSRLQLTEAREYQALELSRLANVPPYLVGAPAGTGMTYQNAQQARQDLIDFGSLPYIVCIEQTLSGPNVTPAGQQVRFDLEAWLRTQQLAGDLPDPSPPPGGAPE